MSEGSLNEDSVVNTTLSNQGNRKVKIIGLHGWRTNASILKMQTGAMAYHTGMEISTFNAPWEADGPPDEKIAFVFPNHFYYQWYNRVADQYQGLDDSLAFLDSKFEAISSTSGGLGFSQGAGVLTLFLIYSLYHKRSYPVSFAILIGGIEPALHPCLELWTETLDIPSLHIIGEQDPFKHRSERLMTYFNPSKRIVLYHSEGHNIPSVRTGIYREISSWLESLQNN